MSQTLSRCRAFSTSRRASGLKGKLINPAPGCDSNSSAKVDKKNETRQMGSHISTD